MVRTRYFLLGVLFALATLWTVNLYHRFVQVEAFSIYLAQHLQVN